MKISDVMTRNPYTLSSRQTVLEAATLFLKHKIDGVPIMDNDKLVGFIGKTQLYKVLSNKNRLEAKLGDIMLTDGSSTLFRTIC